MSGRKAAKDVRPGNMALSVGNPKLVLPEGWQWVDLGDIATMATGHTPSRNHPEYWGGNIPWISVRDARPYHSKMIFSTYENTNELGINKSAAVVLPKGTVCLSRTGSIGYSIILGREMATSQGFVNWICSSGLLPRYLQLLFVAENTFLHSISEGVAHTTIYFPEAKAFHIALPPLPEQHRIVAKIEELFSELDKGIETLKTAKQQLKVYRQAVLKYAFEGNLTKYDRELKFMPLGKILQVVSGNTPKGLDNAIGSGNFQFYKVSDMNLEQNKVEMKASKHLISEEMVKALKIKTFPKGTVIFPKRGGAILTNKKRILSKDSSFDLNLMGVLPNKSVDGMFLFYWFQKLDLSKIYDGSSVPQINNKNIDPLEFPLFPIVTQQEIVQEIESRLSVCDKIEESIEQGLQQAEALRQSILKKAFEGKLVPQDSNDEPASVLLERIKAEHANAQPEKKTIKRTKKAKV